MVLDAWIEQIPCLGKWYEFKEIFLNIFQLRDGAEAERRYDLWDERVQKELPGAFSKLRTAMRNWRRPIFNYFNGRITNALTESINGRIKELQRQGRGYQFEVLKVLILYAEYQLPRRKPKRRGRRLPSTNPSSKVCRLKLAFDCQDQTLGLIPNPSSNTEWLGRFGEVKNWLSAKRSEARQVRNKPRKEKTESAQLEFFSER